MSIQFLEPSRLTNWPAVQEFVPTRHSDTYPFISTAGGDLGGKSVLVAGASRGIGRQIALSFVRAGCSRIAVAARSSLAELEQDIAAAAAEAGRPRPRVLAVRADLTTEDGVASLASQIDTKFGGELDVLINNAGRCESLLPIPESNVDDYWSTWEVNMKGVYLVTRALIPALLKSPTRTMITVGSAVAHMMDKGLSAYQTSKFAVCRFSEIVAKDYESEGLVAIVAHPGAVATDLVSFLPEEARQLYFTETVELAGDTFAWLARERRSWLSGRFIASTWDMEELEARKDEIVSRDLLKFRLTI